MHIFSMLKICHPLTSKDILIIKEKGRTEGRSEFILPMAGFGIKSVFRLKLVTLCNLIMASVLVYAERNMKHQVSRLTEAEQLESNGLVNAISFFFQPDRSSYHPFWPEMRLGWQIVVGTIIGFFGAAFGSVGGVGGGGIFVPMLTLIVGFDPKSATAISKCMIMGAAISTVIHNIKLRHPTLDLPIIDYDLVLLIQPVLMLGISIGVTFNVIFPDWLVTVLLIILLIATAVKAFFKGVETWEKETIMKEVAAKHLESAGGSMEVQYKPLPGNPARVPLNQSKEREVTILKNIYWKEVGFLVFVWVAYLVVQIAKNYTATCSTAYWAWNLMQIPVSVAVFLYEAVGLYKGRRKIASRGDEVMNFPARRLLMFCLCGLVAGIVGGLLGIGGGFIMGPLFIELRIPPQVASATANFGMMFSSSMSVVEYYLLHRFPVPYALYFIAVATIASFIGQYVIAKLIAISGRASLIIFVLAFTIFTSAISLGGVGITNTITKIKQGEYMGLDNLCSYTT